MYAAMDSDGEENTLCSSARLGALARVPGGEDEDSEDSEENLEETQARNQPPRHQLLLVRGHTKSPTQGGHGGGEGFIVLNCTRRRRLIIYRACP